MTDRIIEAVTKGYCQLTFIDSLIIAGLLVLVSFILLDIWIFYLWVRNKEWQNEEPTGVVEGDKQ